MADQADEITVNPQIMLLEQVLGEMAAGRLRIPKFQRPFVWRPEQMLNLFDSIERGYPIGSLLVWDTDLPIPSLTGSLILRSQQNRQRGAGFVLDGHQRLSTLFGSLLHRPTGVMLQGQREWMWQIYRVLGDRDDRSDRFGTGREQRTLPHVIYQCRLYYGRWTSWHTHVVSRMLSAIPAFFCLWSRKRSN